ncbi:YndJ family transporter [Halosimplex salinum]|uniref:YndJ family transporter n=1 Tax=Halosimplex salinum TaxID=1710538 RepID=UPI0013DE2DB9|nr:YndJ family transporter [Halosimplex salinum]
MSGGLGGDVGTASGDGAGDGDAGAGSGGAGAGDGGAETGSGDAGDTLSTPLPSVRGVPVTDVSAVAGAALWALAALAGDLSAVGRALALAPLVVVPLGIGLAAERGFEGTSGSLLALAAVTQPAAAPLVLVSLVASGFVATLTAVAWLPVTGLLALAGLLRARERGVDFGPASLSEWLVDAGLAYTTVAAVALVLFQQGITFWFEPVIVLLTAVHFNFAGFALPVLAGVTGRHLGGFDGLAARAVAAVVLVGPAIIAVGISFSPLVEVVAVGAFTLAVAAFGLLVLVRVVPSLDALPAALVGLSALALPASMVLALGYGIAAFGGTNPLGLSIGRMVSLHGSLNAYGFALCGVLGWRLVGESTR